MIIFIAPKNSGLEKCRKIAENFSPKKIQLIRGEDIPLFLDSIIRRGKKAIGITGEDLFKEFQLNYPDCKIKIIERIQWDDKSAKFNKPVLCLLGPNGKSLDEMPKRVKVCINKKYSRLSKKFLSILQYSHGMTFEKIYLSGATEEAFEHKMCDLVIDIVYSGESDIVILGGKND